MTKDCKWPADAVERWSIDRLIPYARNARQHSAAQIDQIAASMQEWGWTNPVLVDPDGGIIAGHGRVEAARKLGIDEVPVMVARGWSKAKKQAYVLADNKLALNASWDNDLLRIELTSLSDMGVDLALLGFDDAYLAALKTEHDEVDADAEWDGMPEFSQDDKTAHQTIVLHFSSDKDVQDFAQLIGQKITNKTRTIWFPAAEIERYADKVYSANVT